MVCGLFNDAVGREIQRLPQGRPVVGVTSLDNHLYVLRGNKSSEQVAIYDIDCYRLQRYLTVCRLGIAYDIVACAHNHCAYISDGSHNSVHKIALSFDTITHWPVNDTLSVSLTAVLLSPALQFVR